MYESLWMWTVNTLGKSNRTFKVTWSHFTFHICDFILCTGTLYCSSGLHPFFILLFVRFYFSIFFFSYFLAFFGSMMLVFFFKVFYLKISHRTHIHTILNTRTVFGKRSNWIWVYRMLADFKWCKWIIKSHPNWINFTNTRNSFSIARILASKCQKCFGQRTYTQCFSYICRHSTSTCTNCYLHAQKALRLVTQRTLFTLTDSLFCFFCIRVFFNEIQFDSREKKIKWFKKNSRQTNYIWGCYPFMIELCLNHRTKALFSFSKSPKTVREIL